MGAEVEVGDLDEVIRGRIRAAGYFVVSIHKILPPLDTAHDVEVLFLGHEHGAKVDRGAPMTAYVSPRTDQTAVLFSQGW